MSNFFYQLYIWGQKHKIQFWSCILVFVLLSSYGAINIKFEEDITRVLPKNEKSTITTKVLDQLRFSDKISVIIEKEKTGTTDDLVELATQFLDSLSTQQQYVRSVQGKVDEDNINGAIEFIYKHLPLFLEQKDYVEIEQKLSKDSIQAVVENNYKTLISPTGMVAKQFIQRDPLGIGFMALKKLQRLNIGEDFHLVDGFIMNESEDKLLLFIDPVYSGTETEHNTNFVRYLEQLKKELNQNYLDRVDIDYFGASFVAVANAQQIKSDIQRTVLVSVSLLLLVLVGFYKKLIIPIVLFVPTALGALVGLVALYFTKDSISAISLSVGAVLIGITIDYALHVLTHYKHCKEIKLLYDEVTRPIIMSCFTTAIAFLCLVFVHSDALKDLGIFASITVMTSGVLSLIIIPHLYSPSSKEKDARFSLLNKIARFPFDKNKGLFMLCLLAVFVSLFTFNKVGFNRDLASLNYFPEELQQAEQKLNHVLDNDVKSLYVTCFGDDLEQVIEHNSLLAKRLQLEQDKGSISKFSSLGSLVLSKSQQKEKIDTWNSFWERNNKLEIKNNLIESGAQIGFKSNTYQEFYTLLDRPFEVIPIQDYKQLNPQIMEEFLIEKEGFVTINTLVQLNEEQRTVFADTFNDVTQYLIIDRKEINEAFLGNLVTDFSSLINYSLLAVAFILLVFFKRIELVIVSMIPIVVTGLITTGLMGIMGIEFNIFSSIVCTLIFGQGVDFTIFMTNALRKEYTTGKDDSVIYRSSIILAVLTTLLAIGTLIFAKHPALRSISIVSIIGLSVSVFTAFVLYPRLFRFCFTSRQNKGRSPITLGILLFNILSYAYFGIFGILYSVLARILMIVVPIPKVKKLKLFGKGMSAYMTSVLYLNPFVKKQIINKSKEEFTKPAIIIANHTSFLDSLTIGMVNSNIVYLVNDWVYKSPVFGRAVQMAGFYPVSKGVDNSVSHLEERVSQGFSLMIFPEGTRSQTNSIQRFHKGAFYLAETLQLDIIPIYIHGNAEVNGKKDPIIYGGHIIVTIGERIAYDDLKYGLNYSDRTKKISRFYKEEFSEIRKELEDKNYFKQKLFLSYLYKEGSIEKEVKSDFLKYSEDYLELTKHLSVSEKILHISNDFGQVNFLLTIQESKRKIVCLIKNDYERNVAQTNYIKQIRSIEYIKSYSELKGNLTTLLLSTNCSMSIPKEINKVVILNRKVVDYQLTDDFELSSENEFVTVFLRK